MSRDPAFDVNPAGLDCYLVGGWVRDALLGRPVGDHDWVVVGSTPGQMEELGFTRVGRDFPVYLHPETHEEYALARTERKQGRGHRGFAVNADPTVTLEEDLARRDLTVNAIALDVQGRYIDPCDGLRDIEQKVLRHVSAAFCEDPLRVFRVARFAAQFPDFKVAAETGALMREMGVGGELRELSAERVWQELSKALGALAPERFFEILAECGCLQDWFADIDVSRLDFKAAEVVLRYAELPLDKEGFRAFARKLKSPNVCLQTALDWLAWGNVLQDWQAQPAARLCDALVALKVAHGPARLERMTALLSARAQVDVAGLVELTARWREVKVRETGLHGPAHGAALRTARLRLLEAARRA